MCGINGIISKDKNKDKLIKSMNEKILHRGPDAEGIFVEGDVALGQRRLSIIDLAGGNQPIYNEDKSILIMYNGEVYNYKELKEELTEYKFETESDTEVVLHGYEKWGHDLPKKLRGMFAYAIYDKNKGDQEISLVLNLYIIIMMVIRYYLVQRLRVFLLILNLRKYLIKNY